VSPANQRSNIAEELAHAAEALRAAEALISLSLFRDAANRLYYAAYHATLALLLTESLEPATHAGVQTLLGLHFVKQGKVPAAMGALLRRLQGYREASDYTRGFVMPEDECRTELQATRQYIDTIRAWVDRGGWTTT
jgi:uncharacterized protein (UPF0332 family)